MLKAVMVTTPQKCVSRSTLACVSCATALQKAVSFELTRLAAVKTTFLGLAACSSSSSADQTVLECFRKGSLTAALVSEIQHMKYRTAGLEMKNVLKQLTSRCHGNVHSTVTRLTVSSWFMVGARFNCV